MKQKTMFLLIVPVLCGLLGAWVVNEIMRPTPPPEVVLLPVAAVDLPSGTVLKDPKGQLVLKPYPKDLVPANALTDLGQLKDKQLVRGVEQNMPITTRDINTSENLLRGVPAGFRAVTVRVDQVTANAGFIVPGSRVDLLCTLQDPARPGLFRTRAFMQNVLVVAVNASDRPPEGGAVVNNPSTVTLAVKLQDVQRIVWAKERGSVGMALRKPGDDDVVPIQDVTSPDGGDEQPDKPAATVAVLLARRNIPAGTVIDNIDDYFRQATYPASLAVGAIPAENKELLRGRPVVQMLVASYPATHDHFAELPAGEVFVLTIYEGGKPPVVAKFANWKPAPKLP